ncbi:MAG: Fur family transcriptional regulator [Dongiaceae bacterium]
MATASPAKKPRRKKNACDTLWPLSGAKQSVLDVIAKSKQPIGAYAILERLRKILPKAAPPTVYRALTSLEEQGLIHRIEKLNAYVACHHPHAHHQQRAGFLICSKCGSTQELSEPLSADSTLAAAKKAGFEVERQIMEIIGTCADCR